MTGSGATVLLRNAPSKHQVVFAGRKKNLKVVPDATGCLTEMALVLVGSRRSDRVVILISSISSNQLQEYHYQEYLMIVIR